jgi:hypothetical protein
MTFFFLGREGALVCLSWKHLLVWSHYI